MIEWLWGGKPWQAFKNFALIFSFTVNLVLLLVLLIAAPLIIPLIHQVARPIVGGLNRSFVAMSAANIVRTIEVHDDIPVVFDQLLHTRTRVTLTEPVPVTVPATFAFPAGGGTINGTVSLELPAGMELPVELNLLVPVSHTLPVNLNVAVDIPLDETELGKPFGDLQALFAPLDRLLSNLPASNSEFFARLREGTLQAGLTAEPERLSGR